MAGVDIYPSARLPRPPSPGTEARRIVRHGLADVLEWLGEDVGPAPDAPVNAMKVGGMVLVSIELFETIRETLRQP